MFHMPVMRTRSKDRVDAWQDEEGKSCSPKAMEALDGCRSAAGDRGTSKGSSGSVRSSLAATDYSSVESNGSGSTCATEADAYLRRASSWCSFAVDEMLAAEDEPQEEPQKERPLKKIGRSVSWGKMELKEYDVPPEEDPEHPFHEDQNPFALIEQEDQYSLPGSADSPKGAPILDRHSNVFEGGTSFVRQTSDRSDDEDFTAISPNRFMERAEARKSRLSLTRCVSLKDGLSQLNPPFFSKMMQRRKSWG